MKIAAVIILYHPAKDTISNIKTYYDYVDKIFVFDNSEAKSVVQDDLMKLSKIEFHQDFSNEGIAKRLNEASEIALKEQFEWILTMDQDTSFSADAICNYFDCFHHYKNKEKVAMFGTVFSRNTNIGGNDCKSKEVDKLITSGSLLNLSLFQRIGEFDEALFIDAVDFDYCFRAIIAGFSVIQFSNIYISHLIGDEVDRASIKTLFLIKKKKEIHSPLRLYYMYRNMLFLVEKYKDQDKKFSKQIRGYVMSRISVCILYGRNTWKTIRYLRAAKSDFKNNKMGKIR